MTHLVCLLRLLIFLPLVSAPRFSDLLTVGVYGAEDYIRTSSNLNANDFLRACIELLNRMQEKTNGTINEKTILAIPKYMAYPDNQFELLPFISTAQELTSRMMIFWYQTREDYILLTDLINEHNPENVIVLLDKEQVICVIEKDGTFPPFPSWLTVKNENITVIYDEDDTQTTEAPTSTSQESTAMTTDGSTTEFTDGTGVPKQGTVFAIASGVESKPNKIGILTLQPDEVSISASLPTFFNFSRESIEAILRSRPMRLALTPTPPFVIYSQEVKPATTAVSCGIGNLSGLSVDLVRALLDPLNVTYECKCFPEGSEGEILKGVYEGVADMALGDFAVIPELNGKFDFIKNYLYFTISILERPEDVEEKKSYLWLFFEPLSSGSWVMVVFASVVVALVLATLNYFSPNNMDYGFIESVFVTFGCLFQGLTVSPPNRWSSRFILSVWWLFVLFFIVIYIANFAAIIMLRGIMMGTSGFQSLLVNPSPPFGALPNSLASRVLKNSDDLLIEKVNYLSLKLYPQNASDNATLENRVKEVREGKYRLISDSFTLKYFASKYCLAVNGELSSQQYAIILKKDTVYTDYLNDLLTNLTETGKVKEMIDSYSSQNGSQGCDTTQRTDGKTSNRRHTIGLDQVGGIFILMLIGTIVAIALAIVECFFARKLTNLASRTIPAEYRAKIRNFF